MKISINFSTILKIILYLLVGLSIAMAVFSVLGFLNVPNILNVTPGRAMILLPSAIVTLIVEIALATIHYKADEKYLRISLLFFDILGGRIRIQNILNIVYSQNKMYISYIWKGNDPVIANIMIAPKHFDKLKDYLMTQNKGIVFFEDKDEVTDSQQ